MFSPTKFLFVAALWLAAILPVFSQPLNDDCADATILTVSPAAVCGTLTEGSTEQATASPLPSCPGCPEGPDVWYRFSATKTAHLVSVSDAQFLSGQPNYYGLLNLAAYTGTCGSLGPLGREVSFYQEGKLLLGNLTVGESYYLRLLRPENNSDYPVRFKICASTPQPPANDECAGATPISANCSPQTSGSLFGATASRKDCTGESAADVWYVFAALTASQRVQLSAALTYGYGFELYGGDDCDHLISIGCESGSSLARTFEGLTVGAVYYLRVFGTAYQYPDFQVCVTTVPPPPANDECAGALSFDVNPNYSCNLRIYGSTLGATSSQPDCGSGGPTHDVWHSFKAAGPGHRLGFSYVQNIYGDYQDLGYEVYASGCGSLNSLVCKRNGQPNAILSGLIPGDTYFVRVYSLNSSNHRYEFCVQTLPPPPANADCATATVLISAPLPTCGTPVTGSTEGLVLAKPTATCNQQGEGMFVWYTFQATQSTHVAQVSDVQQRYGQGDWWIELYEGGDCGTLKELGCYDENAFFNGAYLKNLSVGTTYYLRFGSRAASAHSFQICLGHYPQPVNDDCAGALPLTAHGDLTCYYPSTGNTASSTPSQPSTACLSNKNDLWFRFKALQTTQRVAISEQASVEDGTYQRLTMELFDGGCGNLTSLNCWPDVPQNYGTTLLLTDLEPGHTYYLRFAQADDVPTRFLVCLLSPPPPPVNDRCVDATVLTPVPEGECGWTAGSTKSATPTLGLPEMCCEKGDVWYQFTASQTNQDILLSDITGGYWNGAGVDVYSSVCGTFDLIATQFLYGYSNEVFPLANLSSGATYLVRVAPRYDKFIHFNICVSAPPVPQNDDCAGALPLQVGTDLDCYAQQFFTYGATPSQQGCEGASASDLWYQFTATATAYLFDISVVFDGIKGDRGMEILSGSCGQFTSLACSKFSEQRKWLEQHGFVPGETYYVRLWGEAAEPQRWEMCIRALPAPPPNDDCAAALPLTTAAALPCSAPITGTTLGATQSLPGCTGNEVRDVWYTFTAESTANLLAVNIEQNYLYSDGLIGVEVLEGDCATAASIFCQQDFGYSGNWTLPDLTVGKPYLVRVFNRPFGASDFSLCLSALSKPANDDCAQATTAAVNPDLKCALTTPGTTAGAHTEGSAKQPDVWYVFTALASKHLIELQNLKALYGPEYTARCEVYRGNPCDNGTLVGEGMPYGPLRLEGLAAGETYSVRVFATEPNTVFAFDLCIRTLPPPPPNMSCATAQPLPVNPNLTCDQVMHGSTAGLPGEMGYGTGCNAWPQLHPIYEMWYSFTAITPNHRVQTSHVVPVIGPGSWFFGVAVVKSADCGKFETVGCTAGESDLLLQNLTPGQTYYVVVSNAENGSAHEFDLCVTTHPVPANDACASATPIAIAPGEQCADLTIGTTLSASTSPEPTTCLEAEADVWFTFTATRSAHTLHLEEAYGYNFSLEVYSGDCGHLQNLLCYFYPNTPYEIALGGLTPESPYWVRIKGRDAGFRLCISTPATESPANDDCPNATTLAVSPDLNCAATVSGTTFHATPSLPLGTFYQQYRPSSDMWYQFTATQSNHAVVLSNYTDIDYSVALQFEAYVGTCGSLTPVAGTRLYNSPKELKLLDLTPGETYYVRVSDHPNYPHTFDICVVSLPAPPNDECAGAILLAENTDLECQSQTTAAIGWATQSAPDCAGGKAHDVWYQFVATAPDYRLDVGRYNPSGIYPKFGMEVLEGTCGGPLSVVLPCAEYTEANVELHQLSIGKTYYVRLYANLLDFLETNICLRTLPAPPANDDCAQALVIEPSNTPDCGPLYTGTTLGSTPSGKDCTGQPSNDVWYRFTATQPNCLLEIAMTKSYLDYSNFIGLALYKGDDCGNLSEVGCFNLYGTPFSLPALTVGSTYYLRVFCSPKTAFDFTLCLHNVQTNTTCASAVRINPSPNDQCDQPMSGSTSGLSETTYSNCYGGYDHTQLWYRFTATSGIHLIRLQNVAHQYGGGFLSMELLSDCFHLTSCGTEIFATSLNPGQDYFVRVVGQINSGSRFELCVLTPEQPDNDNCPGAVTLPVSSNLDCVAKTPGTTLGATGSYNKFDCKSGPDVLYRFVATNFLHYVHLSDLEPSANLGEAFVEVLQGPCSNWAASIGCYPVLPEITVDGLLPGETYYLRIGSKLPKDYFRFEVCIATPQPNMSISQILPPPCQQGSDGTVVVTFANWGYGSIPAQAAQFTLTLSGASSGTYGPVSNSESVFGESSGSVAFTGVNLSQVGETQITVSAVLPNDATPDNNTLTTTFTGLPLRPFYRDADYDGYGDPAISVQDCVPPAGYVDNNTDCDDTDPARNPGTLEICNGFDDNCDGLTDAADPGLADAPPPGITCPADIDQPNDAGDCSAKIDYTVSASDNCGYTITQPEGLASGTDFPVGSTLNTFIVSAPDGSTASCSFTVTVQKTADPDLVYAYTVIGLNDVSMKNNTVQSGGVGVMGVDKKVRLQSGTIVTAANTFVKAPVLELTGSSQATTTYNGQVDIALLPIFKSNPTPTTNNLTVPSSSAPVTLALGSYGTLTVGYNSTVIFSGHATVRLQSLTLKDGAKVLFGQNTELLINSSVVVGRAAEINPGGTHVVQCFAGKNVSVKTGARVWADVRTLQDLRLEKATAALPIQMTGLFIANNVVAEDFAQWNWDATRCPVSGQKPILTVERQDLPAALPPPSLLHISPNPASEVAQVMFDLEKTDSEVLLQLLDATGHAVRTERWLGAPGSNAYRLQLGHLPEGMYVVQVLAEGQRWVEKLVVLRD